MRGAFLYLFVLVRVALMLTAAAVCGCGGEGEGDRPPARNLILISIDTLRADRLGCYGYERATSPALDRFAAGAVRFERAYAASSWTLPAHVTLLSGLLPATHGVQEPDLVPGRDTPLFAELLRDAGWYTFARTDGGWLSADFGFDRGFLSFHAERRGIAPALAEAREAIAAAHRERPFFVFLHSYDVHCPYTPGPPWEGLFASEGAAPIETEGRCGNPDFNARGVSDAEARFLSDRYDGEIRKLDDELAGFFAFLEQQGVLDDTVVAITSDHGEEFLEHGRIGHEGTLYAELLHVPLVIRAPGVAAAVVAELARQEDVLPTLLELLGVEPPAVLDGRSLVPSFVPRADGSGVGGGIARAELRWNGELSSVIQGRDHLVLHRDGRVELYDLSADPREAHDLAQEDPARARALVDVLQAAEKEARAQALEPIPAAPGAGTRAVLEGLGYAGGGR